MRSPSDEKGTDERRPAGPVDAGDPPSPALQGTVPPTTPPAGQASSPAADKQSPAGDAAERDDGSREVEEDFGKLLQDAHQERDEYLELAKRTKADFENYRKRMAAEVQAAQVRGKAAVAREV